MDNIEYFSNFKKKFNYFVDIIPITIIHVFFEFGVITEYKGKKKKFECDFNISVSDYIENIVRPYFQKFFPSFVRVLEKEVPITPDKVKKLLRKNSNLKIKDIVEMKEKIKVKIIYTIEGIHSRDGRLIVNDGSGLYLYAYPFHIEDIRSFIMNKTKEGLSNFIFEFCKNKREYNKNFKINIKYTGEQMFNFFRLNKDKVKKDIFYNPEKDLWEWGRYNIYFENDKMEYKCLNVLKGCAYE
jgi:hypothetical protein